MFCIIISPKYDTQTSDTTTTDTTYYTNYALTENAMNEITSTTTTNIDTSNIITSNDTTTAPITSTEPQSSDISKLNETYVETTIYQEDSFNNNEPNTTIVTETPPITPNDIPETTNIVTGTLENGLIYQVNGNTETTPTTTDENYINGFDISEHNKIIVELTTNINKYRKENGLEDLKTCDVLNQMANVRASEIPLTGLNHTRPNGSNYISIFSDNNISISSSGEIYSFKHDTVDTIDDVLNRWESSTSNTEILGNYQYVGVGVFKNDDYYYWSVIFCSSNDISLTDNGYIIN